MSYHDIAEHQVSNHLLDFRNVKKPKIELKSNESYLIHYFRLNL